VIDKINMLSAIYYSTVDRVLLIAPHQSSIRKRDIGRESRLFAYPMHLHSTPPLWRFSREYCHSVWYGKLEWRGYPKVKKVWRYVYSFRQNTWTWWTDRQTDRHRTTA